MSRRKHSNIRKLNPHLKSHRPKGETRTLRRSVFYVLKEALGILKEDYRKVRNAHRNHHFDAGRRPLERHTPKAILVAHDKKHHLSASTDRKISKLMGDSIPSVLPSSYYDKRKRGTPNRKNEAMRRRTQAMRIARKNPW